MTEQVDQKQRMLKRIVIILGILIVIAVMVLVGGIAYRASNMGESGDIETITARAPVPEFGNLLVEIPPGARVVSGAATEYEIHVLIETAGAGRQLLVVDRATGERLGTVRFVSEAPVSE